MTGIDETQNAENELRLQEEAYAQLARAYRATFNGKADEATAKAVLQDLADFTGFYKVNGVKDPDTGLPLTVDERIYSDALRFTFARIANFLNMSEDEVQRLERGSRFQFLDT